MISDGERTMKACRFYAPCCGITRFHSSRNTATYLPYNSPMNTMTNWLLENGSHFLASSCSFFSILQVRS